MNEDCKHPVNESAAHYVITWMGSLGLTATVVCSTAALLVFVFKLHKYFVHRLALYQVLAASFYGLALTLELVFLAVDKYEHRWLCETIGFLFFYFSWVKVLFTAWVVLHLFCFTVFYKNLQNLEVLFVIISIVTPLVFTWIPFVNDVYGPAGAWCWIESWKNNCVDNISYLGVVEQFTLGYGPAMIFSIVESIAIVVIVLRLLFCYQPVRDEEMSLLSRSQRRKAFKELLPLLVYPILFCVLLTLPMINKVIWATSSKQPQHGTLLDSGIFVPMQPFFAGLTLLIHVVVLKFPKSALLKKCFNCRHRSMHFPHTTKEDHTNSWQYTDADRPSTYSCITEAIVPDESVVDSSILSQKKHLRRLV